MKLYIPEPCPEKWENMIPNKEGAFCSVCNKNVIDFTSQNKSQVVQYIEKRQAGKEICGKLSLQQLLEFNPPKFNFDDFFAKFRLWNITRKIALIIFVFFGLGLASCGGGLREVPDAYRGQATVRDTSTNSTTNHPATNLNDTLNSSQQNPR